MSAIHQPNFEYTDSILKNWQCEKCPAFERISKRWTLISRRPKEQRAASREKSVKAIPPQ